MATAQTRIMYSVSEVQEMTGLGRSTVWAEVYAGRLATVRIGKRRLITSAALSEWVASLSAEHPAPSHEAAVA